MAISDKNKEKIIKSYKSKIDSYINSYLKQTIKTGNTPSLSTMQTEVKAYVIELANADKELAFYSASDIQSVINECSSYGDSAAAEKYNESLAETPRTVNGVSPIARDTATGAPTNKNEVVGQIKNVLDSRLIQFFQLCTRSQCCPDEAQMSNYIDDMISSALRQLVPSNMTDKDKGDIEKTIKKYKNTLLEKYRAFAKDKTITHTMPSEADPNGVLGRKSSVKTTRANVSEYAATNTTFSGCDMVVNAQCWINEKKCVDVVMGTLATLSYSIFQQKFPINAIGNVNAKDYVMGPRTIAGSLVFIVFNQHWAQDLLKQFSEAMGWPSSRKVLIDEIAPLNLTISMCNEYGFRSRLAIYGVRLFSEGQVMSINDMYTENTFQYVALNIDYMTNIEGENDDAGSDTSSDETTTTSVPTLPTPNSGGEQIEQKEIDAAVESYAWKTSLAQMTKDKSTLAEFNVSMNQEYNSKINDLKKDLNDGKIAKSQYDAVVTSYQSTVMNLTDQAIDYYKAAAKTESSGQ